METSDLHCEIGDVILLLGSYSKYKVVGKGDIKMSSDGSHVAEVLAVTAGRNVELIFSTAVEKVEPRA